MTVTQFRTRDENPAIAAAHELAIVCAIQGGAIYEMGAAMRERWTEDKLPGSYHLARIRQALAEIDQALADYSATEIPTNIPQDAVVSA